MIPPSNQQRSDVRRFLRISSLAILLTFLVHNIQGYPVSVASEIVRADRIEFQARQFSLPSAIGTIEEIYQAPSQSPVVILVQNAHAIPEAQRNIQKIIQHSQKQYGLSLVAVEGASAALDAQIFRSFPEKPILKKVFSEYFDKAELTGAVASAIFNKGQSLYQGVEDRRLYETGLGLYAAASEQEPSLLEKLSLKEKILQTKKKAAYSKKLLEIDGILQSFHQNRRNLMQVLQLLAKIQRPERGSETALLLEESERDLQNRASIESEVKKIAAEVKNQLASLPSQDRALRKFSRKLQEYQTSQISAEAFALFLQQSTQSRMTNHLQHLIKNQKRMRDMEGTKLFHDFEHYVNKVKDTLFRNEEERALDRESRKLELLGRLICLEITREDWEELKTFVSSNAILPMDSLKVPLSFYENASQRDRAFSRRLISLMREKKTKSAMLIVGGFHTEGLTQRLKEENISYVLVMPQIGAVPAKTPYREHMRGEVSWKDYFESENGKINFYKAFVRSARDKLLGQSRQEPAGLLKAWRDQILRDLAEQGRVAAASQYTSFLDEASQVQRQEFLGENFRKIDAFVEKLRGLDATGKLTGKNVLKLLQPATIEDLAGNVTCSPADRIPIRIEVPGLGSYTVVKSGITHLRSEARVDALPFLIQPQMNAEDIIRIFMLTDPKIQKIELGGASIPLGDLTQKLSAQLARMPRGDENDATTWPRLTVYYGPAPFTPIPASRAETVVATVLEQAPERMTKPDRRRFRKVVESGQRTGDEVTGLIRVASEQQVPAASLIFVADRYPQMPVPLIEDLAVLARQTYQRPQTLSGRLERVAAANIQDPTRLPEWVNQLSRPQMRELIATVDQLEAILAAVREALQRGDEKKDVNRVNAEQVYSIYDLVRDVHITNAVMRIVVDRYNFLLNQPRERSLPPIRFWQIVQRAKEALQENQSRPDGVNEILAVERALNPALWGEGERFDVDDTGIVELEDLVDSFFADPRRALTIRTVSQPIFKKSSRPSPPFVDESAKQTAILSAISTLKHDFGGIVYDPEKEYTGPALDWFIPKIKYTEVITRLERAQTPGEIEEIFSQFLDQLFETALNRLSDPSGLVYFKQQYYEAKGSPRRLREFLIQIAGAIFAQIVRQERPGPDLALARGILLYLLCLFTADHKRFNNPPLWRKFVGAALNSSEGSNDFSVVLDFLSLKEHEARQRLYDIIISKFSAIFRDIHYFTDEDTTVEMAHRVFWVVGAAFGAYQRPRSEMRTQAQFSKRFLQPLDVQGHRFIIPLLLEPFDADGLALFRQIIDDPINYIDANNSDWGLLDPHNKLRRQKIRFKKGVGLNRRWHTAGASRGVHFPGFEMALGWLDLASRTFYLEQSLWNKLAQLPPQVRELFANHLEQVFTEDSSPLLSPSHVTQELLTGDLLPALASFHEQHFGFDFSRRKKPAETSAPILIQNVWAERDPITSRKIHTGDVAEHLRPITGTEGIAPAQHLIANLRQAVRILFQFYGDTFPDYFVKDRSPLTSKQIDVGLNLNSPMKIEDTHLIFDAGFLSLPEAEFEALLRFALKNAQQASRLAHPDARLRNLAVYFDFARASVWNDPEFAPQRFLESSEKFSRHLLSVLRRAYEELGRRGWDTQAHAEFLGAVQQLPAALRQTTSAGDLQTRTLGWGANPEKRLRRFLWNHFKRGETSLLEQLIPHPIDTDLKKEIEYWRRRFFLVPTVEDTARLGFELDIPFAQAFQLLSLNTNLLLGIYYEKSIKQAIPFFRYATLGMLHEDLEKRESLIAGVISLIDEGKKDVEIGNYLEAVSGYNRLGRLVGFRRMRDFARLFGLGWKDAARDHFFVTIDQKFKEEATLYQVIESTLNKIDNALVYPDGNHYLIFGGWPEALTHFVLWMSQLDLSAHQNRPDIERFRAKLVVELVQRWGLVFGAVLRTGISEPMRVFLDKYRFYFEEILEKLEPALLAGADDAVLEAYFLLRSYFYDMPASDDFMALARGRLQAEFPEILQRNLELDDPSPRAAVGRAAYRYLTTVEDSFTLAYLSSRLVEYYLQAEPEQRHPVGRYAQGTLAIGKSSDLRMLGNLGHALLLHSIRLTDDSLRAAELAAIMEAVQKHPPAERQALVDAMALTDGDIQLILERGSGPVKNFFLGYIPAARVAALVNQQPIHDQVELLAETSGPAKAPVAEQLERQKAVRRLEIYQEHQHRYDINGMPNFIEIHAATDSPALRFLRERAVTFSADGGSIANYYKVLGVPRRATAEMIVDAYRALLAISHTDPNPGDAETRDLYNRVNEAKEILRDTELRNAYDAVTDHTASHYPASSWFQDVRVSGRPRNFRIEKRTGLTVEDIFGEIQRRGVDYGVVLRVEINDKSLDFGRRDRFDAELKRQLEDPSFQYIDFKLFVDDSSRSEVRWSSVLKRPEINEKFFDDLTEAITHSDASKVLLSEKDADSLILSVKFRIGFEGLKELLHESFIRRHIPRDAPAESLARISDQGWQKAQDALFHLMQPEKSKKAELAGRVGLILPAKMNSSFIENFARALDASGIKIEEVDWMGGKGDLAAAMGKVLKARNIRPRLVRDLKDVKTEEPVPTAILDPDFISQLPESIVPFQIDWNKLETSTDPRVEDFVQALTAALILKAAMISKGRPELLKNRSALRAELAKALALEGFDPNILSQNNNVFKVFAFLVKADLERRSELRFQQSA